MNQNDYINYTPITITTPESYLKVPSSLILKKEISDKRISCFQYLCRNTTFENTVAYCPTYMINWCGYKASWNRSNKTTNIYMQFLESMQWLWENGYIIDFDRGKFVGQMFQSSFVNVEKLRSPQHFGILYDFEIEKIKAFNSSYKPLSKSILLLVLSYIRLKTWNRKTEISGYSEKSKKEKPEICHKKYIEIAEDIGVSAALVSKAINTLVELGFIALRPMPRFQDEDGYWHTGDTLFVTPYKFMLSKEGNFYQADLESYNFKQELKNGVKFLKEQKYGSKKFYQE